MAGIFDGRGLVLSVMQGYRQTDFPNFDTIRPQDRHLPSGMIQFWRPCGAILLSRFRVSASISRKSICASRKRVLSMPEFILIRPPLGKPHHHPAPFSDKPCRNPEKLPADSPSHLLSTAAPHGYLLEPVHEVVGQNYQLEVQPGAGPVFRNARVQTETVDALLDEILAAGTLVVALPDLFAGKLAVGGDNLVVIELFLDAEQLELLSGRLTTFYGLSNDNETDLFVSPDGDKYLTRCPVSIDLVPCANAEDQSLNPALLGYHHIEFDSTPPKPFQKVPVKKAAVSPEPYQGIGRQFTKHPLQESYHMVIGAVSRTEKTSEAVPGFSHKTQKRMVTFSSALLRVVAAFCPMLIAEHRDDVRIEIKRDFLHILKALTDALQKHLIDSCQAVRLVNGDLCEKPADRALRRETVKTDDLLKYLVRSKFHHMARSKDPHHQPIEHGKAHLRRGIVIFSAFLCSNDCHGVEETKFVKEPSHQTGPSKAGDILSSETFQLVLTAFFWYILFHLLGASFPLCLDNHILPERRLFAFKNSQLFCHKLTSTCRLKTGTA